MERSSLTPEFDFYKLDPEVKDAPKKWLSYLLTLKLVVELNKG